MTGPSRWLAIAVLALSGCPEADIRSGDGGSDAGAADAAAADAGTVDSGAADAGTPDGGLPDPATFDANVVFVTSSVVAPGELGGIAGADDLCNELAMRAGLPDVGSYVAWLSTATTPAVSRLDSARGWVRRDGQPFADTPMDIVEGRIWAPASLDETGADASRSVVTGTNAGGTLQGESCGEWRSTAGEVRWGRSTDGTRRWTSSGDQACSRAAPLYCFGTGRLTPVAPRAHFGRLVFRTRDRLGGTEGRDAMDAACNADAVAAGFGDRRVVAFVSTASEAAIGRVGEGEPWVRPDGVLVARSIADLTRQALLAPITPSADFGGYRDDVIWAGAPGPDLRSTAGQDCAEWSDPRGMGSRGAAGAAQQFFEGSPASCTSTFAVLCFEP